MQVSVFWERAEFLIAFFPSLQCILTHLPHSVGGWQIGSLFINSKHCGDSLAFFLAFLFEFLICSKVSKINHWFLLIDFTHSDLERRRICQYVTVCIGEGRNVVSKPFRGHCMPWNKRGLLVHSSLTVPGRFGLFLGTPAPFPLNSGLEVREKGHIFFFILLNVFIVTKCNTKVV